MFDRRDFLKATLLGVAGGWSPALLRAAETQTAGDLHIAPFRFDVTPPEGHSLCGGWIRSVLACDDPLECLGFVLLGAGKPIVVCAVDWTGLLNSAHHAWRAALADAAGTSVDRVAVQCVHQHNAPMACLDTQAIVATQEGLPHVVLPEFFQQCLDAGATAVRAAVKKAEPVTHIAHGRGKVERVASNRRFVCGEGKIKQWRGSSAKSAELRALPEGLIDPWLRTVAFYNCGRKLVSAHYYATHPMSYYGDGRVTAEFVGMARRRREEEDAGCLHVYFTGCAGNVAAGKYNDGSHRARCQLTDRIYAGIVASEEKLEKQSVRSVTWETAELLPPPNPAFDAAELEMQIGDRNKSVVHRNRPAYILAWLRRCAAGTPLPLSALHLDGVSLLHLPGESFVEYQLRAQEMFPDRFVATAAYGDGGPWYIPVSEAYPQGGYEVSVAFCAPEVDGLLTSSITTLLSTAKAG